LRDELPTLRIMNNCAGGSFKAQMKRADKSGAAYAIILGDNELSEGLVTLKPLRNQGDQQQVANTNLVEQLKNTALEGA